MPAAAALGNAALRRLQFRNENKGRWRLNPSKCSRCRRVFPRPSRVSVSDRRTLHGVNYEDLVPLAVERAMTKARMMVALRDLVIDAAENYCEGTGSKKKLIEAVERYVGERDS